MMPVGALLVACLAATFAVLAALLGRGRARSPRVLIVCLVVCLVTSAAFAGLDALTIAKGAPHDGPLSQAPMAGVFGTLSVTPFDDSASVDSSDVSGRVIIVYRYGCNDCEGAYPALSKRLAGLSVPVSWVSSRSDVGRKLCKRYDVEWVPTALSVSDSGTVVSRMLFPDDVSDVDAVIANVS